MQIKITISYHYKQIRVNKVKNSDNTKCWQRFREMTSDIASRNVKQYGTLKNSLAVSLKSKYVTTYQLNYWTFIHPR